MPPVTILGTSVRMVDRWLTLRECGYHGPIVAVSWHGFTPLCHGAYPTPLSLPAVALARSTSESMLWLRDLATQVTH